MSTIRDRLSNAAGSGPLRVRSVVGLAYDEIRAMIVDGRLAPGSRVGQARARRRARDLARLGARGAAAARRATGSSTFEVNRGFFVAERRARRRARATRGAARCSSPRSPGSRPRGARRTTSRRCGRAVADERAARSAAAAHDASRAFHAALVAGDPERGTHADLRRALDRRRRPAAPRQPAPPARLAGGRRRGARASPRGDRGADGDRAEHADAGARRERVAALVAPQPAGNESRSGSWPGSTRSHLGCPRAAADARELAGRPRRRARAALHAGAARLPASPSSSAGRRFYPPAGQGLQRARTDARSRTSASSSSARIRTTARARRWGSASRCRRRAPPAVAAEHLRRAPERRRDRAAVERRPHAMGGARRAAPQRGAHGCAGQAASHAGKGWEQFTDRVIRELSERRDGIVFLLWGRYAQQKGAIVDRTRHHVLAAAHPSPFSAANGFLGCCHFSQANALLEQRGRRAVDWSLP